MSAWWRRLHLKAEGSLPANKMTRIGVAVTAILLMGFFLSYLFFGRETPATGTEQGDADAGPQSPRDFTSQMAARVETESLREGQRRAAEDRDRERELMTAGIAGGRVTTGGSPPPTSRDQCGDWSRLYRR